MVQSLSGVYIHLVFSTQHRKPLILEAFEKRLHDYLASIATDLKCTPFEINGTADYVHLLLALHRTISISDLAEKIKSNSSRWFKKLDPSLADFSWQGGYAGLNVDIETFDRLREYIINQKERYKSLTFKEEYIRFLKWAKIKYDVDFLWD